MRKEIEVKARVTDLNELARKLEAMGCVLSAPVKQSDTVYVSADYGPFEEFQPGKNLLRIRETDGKTLFTIKQPQSNDMDVLEREVEVGDVKELQQMLELLGYHEVVPVSKTRREGRYKEYGVCLDEVEGLGSFIELERITEGEVDAEKIQKEMSNFLVSLGIPKEDHVMDGYDTLVYLKQGK